MSVGLELLVCRGEPGNMGLRVEEPVLAIHAYVSSGSDSGLQKGSLLVSLIFRLLI